MRRRHQNIRRNRLLRDYDNPLDYLDDFDIIRRYRLSRPMIIDLCRRFDNDLHKPTMRSRALPVSLQIMAALRFFATGSFQLVNADVHNISRSSVSRCVRNVTQCLVNVCNQHIIMPTDAASLEIIKRGFYEIADFPNVVGAVDGTHVRIKSPSVDEHIFVNRKKFHSINVQGVCDSNLKLLNIVSQWSGATHDAFIWSIATVCELFENRTISDGWLLGDSGYPVRPWLLTPVLNPSTRKQQTYNGAHMRTRNVVERSFGVLKARFRCIDTSAGTLLYSALMCCRIVVAVAVLHNLCIVNRMPLPPDRNDFPDHGHIAGPAYNGH
ncbi:HARBI1 [Mytilus coruscus]|uniref:Putative nuclease HARBI1 n=1 Tax=Mytilus coruscus TaxID=42192 RepID=A0A6J8EKX5_MYTCO|nr:HARBI1 [Mytilus coruscus]